jgi:hypothetical protein
MQVALNIVENAHGRLRRAHGRGGHVAEVSDFRFEE